MIFSDCGALMHEGRFLVTEKVSGVANYALCGKVFSEFWRGFNHHRSEIELEGTDMLIFSVGNAKIPEVFDADIRN